MFERTDRAGIGAFGDHGEVEIGTRKALTIGDSNARAVDCRHTQIVKRNAVEQAKRSVEHTVIQMAACIHFLLIIEDADDGGAPRVVFEGGVCDGVYRQHKINFSDRSR